mmetsp:Transcript_64603/g.151406  ORF Transcript_64603/g.151406 Transcript_64603/m.151406 type:complete len:276 (+) Transcript_64603:506-1333(+)
MLPLGPNGWQTENVIAAICFAVGGCETMHVILQAARLEDVRVVALRVGQEYILAKLADILPHAMVADANEEALVLPMLPGRPDMEFHQRAHEHLRVELNLESFWNAPHQRNVILFQPNCDQAVGTDRTLHLAEELHREVALHEEPLQLGTLHQLFVACHAHRVNARTDGAEEGGKAGHGQENDPDGIEPLPAVVRCDGVRRGGELCKTPVHGGHIGLSKVCLVDVGPLEPVPQGGGPRADGIPATGNQMVHGQHQHKIPDDLQGHDGVGREEMVG